MSTAPSPMPPGAAEDETTSWRAAVEQSYRNSEVREIAKVLAALEPGASASSKLRLAMQFEDTIFKSATSLGDYRKRLTKRLKKVQKSYVPPPSAATAGASGAGGGAGSSSGRSAGGGGGTNVLSIQQKEAALLQLRATYGSTLSYIFEHADTAVQQLRTKHGDEKAAQLKQHTDSVRIWAADLGLLKDKSNYGKPLTNMSDDYLEKLKGHLERRTENIRMHVVKLADPDRFLLETMEKTEAELTTKASQILAAYCRKRYEQLQQQQQQKGTTTNKITSTTNTTAVTDAHVNALFKEAMEMVQKSVPLPTRSQRNDEQAALVHLNKMRAASTLALGYMMIPEKQNQQQQQSSNSQSTTAAATTTATSPAAPTTTTTTTTYNSMLLPKQVLSKANSTANEGTDFVIKVMREIRKNTKPPSVTLEDAWMKQLVLPTIEIPVVENAATPALDGSTTSQQQPPDAKRPRRGSVSSVVSSSGGSKFLPPVIRSKVLLRPDRKTPTNIIAALKRKRATLVRPEPRGEGSHVVLEFGTAFVMTIYMVPLLVTLRACTEKNFYSPSDDETKNTDKSNKKDGAAVAERESAITTSNNYKRSFSNIRSLNGCARYTALKDGLKEQEQKLQQQQQQQAVNSKNTPQQAQQLQQQQQQLQQSYLKVWGTKGSFETIGHVVEERLRDASAHATFVLRKCFEQNVRGGGGGGGGESSVDFEVEIREATALLEFIQLARTTYISDWQDDDD